MDHVLRCYDTFETRIIRGEGCTVYDESGKGYIVGINPTAHLLRFYPPLTIAEENVIGMTEHLDAALAESS